MNIQIFGTKKCFDTKKAQRYFKERNIAFQFIDLKEKPMSKGEFQSVMQSVGGIEAMVNKEGKEKDLLAMLNYLSIEDQQEKIFENQSLLITPIVRNKKKATVGYCPQHWKDWEQE